MLIHLDRFFLDEKDLFVFGYLFFLIILAVLKISIAPFSLSSLFILGFFLILTRSLISQQKFDTYFFIVLLGFLFSLFLSPYGLAIYLVLAVFVYKKTNLI